MKGVTQAGITTDSNVTGTDIYPTLLELAGIELRPKQHLDGVSFVDVLKGKPSARPPMFWEFIGKNTRSSTGDVEESAMRDGNFKLIHWRSESKYELFDVKNDVGETHELSHEMPERKRVMVEELTRWEREMEQVRSQQSPTR
jgi:arylsulfatase A-like enzyme